MLMSFVLEILLLRVAHQCRWLCPGLASRSSLSESSAEALLRFATMALAEAFEGFVRLGV